MRVKTLPIFLLLLITCGVFAQEPATDSVRAPLSLNDDPVANMLDSLSYLTIFHENEYIKSSKGTNYHDSYVPYFSDSVYRGRIADMNEQSPFEYIYNDQVRMFIDLYAYKKCALTSRIIGV